MYRSMEDIEETKAGILCIRKQKWTRGMSRKNHMILFVNKYFISLSTNVFGTKYEKAVFT